VDHSNFTDETDVTFFAGLSLRDDPDGSLKEFVDICVRDQILVSSLEVENHVSFTGLIFYDADISSCAPIYYPSSQLVRPS
jgi:hypothetical protein